MIAIGAALEARESAGLCPQWLCADPYDAMLSLPRGVADTILVSDRIPGGAPIFVGAALGVAGVVVCERRTPDSIRWSIHGVCGVIEGDGQWLAKQWRMLPPGIVVGLWPRTPQAAMACRDTGRGYLGISDLPRPRGPDYPGIENMTDYLHLRYCERFVVDGW